MLFTKKERPGKVELYPLSEEQKDMVNHLSNDLADMEGTNKSQVILSEFVEAHSPKTAQGKVGFTLLYGKDGRVKSALAMLCSRMAAGTEWRPAHGNGKELLEHIDQVLLSNHIRVDWSHQASHHMIKSFACVVSAVESAAGKAGEEGRFNLMSEAEYGAALLREYQCGQKEGYDEPAANLTRFVLANWGVLKDNQMVWRFAASLCDASKYWPDYVVEDGKVYPVRGAHAAKLRLDTLDLLDRITLAWEAEESAEADEG